MTIPYHPDEPLPLKDAIAAFYPHTGLTVHTLRGAIGIGTLKCYKLSRAYCVTKNQLDDWMKLCLVNANQPDCGTAEQINNTSSWTTSTENELKSAQDAALASVEKLKSGSLNTPGKNTKRKSANIVPLNSR